MPFDRRPLDSTPPPQEVSLVERVFGQIQDYFVDPIDFVKLHRRVPDWMVYMIGGLKELENDEAFAPARQACLAEIARAEAMIKQAFTHIGNPPPGMLGAFEGMFQQVRDMLLDPWAASTLALQMKEEMASVGTPDLLPRTDAMKVWNPTEKLILSAIKQIPRMNTTPVHEVIDGATERFLAEGLGPPPLPLDLRSIPYAKGNRPRIEAVIPSARPLMSSRLEGVLQPDTPASDERPIGGYRGDGDDL